MAEAGASRSGYSGAGADRPEDGDSSSTGSQDIAKVDTVGGADEECDPLQKVEHDLRERSALLGQARGYLMGDAVKCANRSLAEGGCSQVLSELLVSQEEMIVVCENMVTAAVRMVEASNEIYRARKVIVDSLGKGWTPDLESEIREARMELVDAADMVEGSSLDSESSSASHGARVRVLMGNSEAPKEGTK